MNSYPDSAGQTCLNGICPQSQYPMPSAGMGNQTQAAAQSGMQNLSQFLNPSMPSSYFPTAQNEYSPITPLTQPMPVTLESMQYINGYLRTQIGRKVTVDFLIGTNTLVDKTGTLLAVGANYIIINEVETDDLLVCDFFNIKFVKIYL